jgi:hypothetical protein
VEQHLDKRAAAQYGNFSLHQARASGLSRRQWEQRERSGLWVRAADDVYRVAGAPLTWRSRCQAALLDAGDRSHVSHRAAARLARFPGYRLDAVDILVPYGLDHVSSVATVHETRRFEAIESTIIDGLRVTSPETTLVLLAQDLRLGRLSWLTDELLASKTITIERLAGVHRTLGGRGFRGSALLRAVIEEREPGSGVPASALERLFDNQAGRHKFPTGEREAPLPGRDDHPERVDRFFRRRRFIIEIDGRRWHTRVADFERDRRRDLAALAAGYRTARITAWMLRYDAAVTFAKLREALDADLAA